MAKALSKKKSQESHKEKLLFHEAIKSRLAARFSKRLSAMQTIGVLPIHLTIASILFKLAALFALYYGNILLAGIFVIIEAFFDAIDGIYARATGKNTPFRIFLDWCSDFTLRPLWFPILALHGYVTWQIAIFAIYAIYFALGTFFLAQKFFPELRQELRFNALWVFTPGFFIFTSEFLLIMAGMNLFYGLNNIYAVFNKTRK